MSEAENTSNFIEEKKSEINEKDEQKYNFIKHKSIIYYYNEFYQEFKVNNYSNNFIIMGLPKNIKGFTFRFFKTSSEL